MNSINETSSIIQKYAKFKQYLQKNEFKFPILDLFQQNLILLYINDYFNKRDGELVDEILPTYIIEFLSSKGTTIQSLESMLESFLEKEQLSEIIMNLYKILKKLSKGIIPDELKKFEEDSKIKTLEQKREEELNKKSEDIYIPNKQDIYQAKKKHFEENKKINLFNELKNAQKNKLSSNYNSNYFKQNTIHNKPIISERIKIEHSQPAIIHKEILNEDNTKLINQNKKRYREDTNNYQPQKRKRDDFEKRNYYDSRPRTFYQTKNSYSSQNDKSR